MYAYGYYYYTFAHTCYSIYTDTLGTLYTVHLCLSVSCGHENPASSLAAPATEFAPIYPHSARSITSVGFHHLILISLLTLPLSFSILTPAVLLSFLYWHSLHTFLPFAILLISSHLSPNFFQDSYLSLSPDLLYNPVQHIPQFLFWLCVFLQMQRMMSRTSFLMRM